MNKLVKGSIAGAAGIALLLGGAGTLAAWNSDATLTGGTINSGSLTVVASGTTTVYYGGTTDVVTLIVPGDVVEVTQNLTIDATGDNLQADLSIDTAALVGTLKDHVTVDVAAYAGTTEITDLTGLTAAQAASITKVVATITFDAATADEIAQESDLDLSSITVLLQQV